MRRCYSLSLIAIFAVMFFILDPLANADVTAIGQYPGQTTVSVTPTEQIQLNINSTSTVTSAETWFCFTMIQGGVQQPIYLITSQGKIVPSSQVTDFSKVTYNFGSGPYTTIGTLTMQSLGLNAGDTLIYGYAVSDSDISHVQIPNIVTIKVQNSNNYAFDELYLQYRTYENTSNNTYGAWIGLLKNGQAIQRSDVTSITVKDSQGKVVWDGTNLGFYAGTFYDYDLSNGTPTQSGPFDESGFSGSTANLSSGTYNVEVETVDGQTLTTQITYPGKLALPVIPSNTMQSSYDTNGNLVLSWTNPTTSPNWPDVTKLEIWLADQQYVDRIYVSLPSNAETVTIPKALLDQAAQLVQGGAPSWQWEIRTRTFDSNGMKYAEGASDWLQIGFLHPIKVN